MNTMKPEPWLRALALSALLLAAPAFAGPPLLCHPFDTSGAPSLSWGGKGWKDARADYDLGRLAADTEVLLAPSVPVIARMETLRRAAIYASRDAKVARTLAARLDARATAAAANDAKALALFDAGYFRETLQEIVRVQADDWRPFARYDRAVKDVLAEGDGNARIDRALALRPDDPSLRFAAALVAAADERKADYNVHARIARAGAAKDRLLALNVGQIAANY